jgi:mRNA interferase MazF
MERFVKGDIVVIPFPFSDLSGSKRRPAFVLADLPGDDIILCQVTSQVGRDNSLCVSLLSGDFASGSLPVNSYIRPTRIFTADKKIILRKAGTVKDSVCKETIDILKSLLERGQSAV